MDYTPHSMRMRKKRVHPRVTPHSRRLASSIASSDGVHIPHPSPGSAPSFLLSFLNHTRPRRQSPSMPISAPRKSTARLCNALIASDTRLESRASCFGRCHVSHSCFDPYHLCPLQFLKNAQASMFELKFTFPTDPTFPGEHQSLTPGSCPKITGSLSQIRSLSCGNPAHHQYCTMMFRRVFLFSRARDGVLMSRHLRLFQKPSCDLSQLSLHVSHSMVITRGLRPRAASPAISDLSSAPPASPLARHRSRGAGRAATSTRAVSG